MNIAYITVTGTDIYQTGGVFLLNTGAYSESFQEMLPDITRAFHHDYDFIKNGKIELLKFSENIVCLVKEPADETKKAVIRIHRPGYHLRNELEAELNWITQINEQTDISTATVYRGVNGEILQKLTTAAGNQYTYSVQSFIQGIPIRQLSGDNLYEQLKKTGGVAAKLHNMEENQPHNPEKFKRFTWDIEDTLYENSRWGSYKEFPYMDSEGQDILSRAAGIIEKRLSLYGRNIRNYGLIHADLHSENILVEGDRISLIDFDDCGYSWFLYDLACAISQQSADLHNMTEAWVPKGL